MPKRGEKSALDIIEEAVYVLRGAPAGAFAAYYIGTLPFLLAFLFFWADMGRSATAQDHAAPAAFGVAALFVWMSAWQAVFAQALRSSLTGTQPARARRLAFVQATLQPTKFVILPLAILITVPLGAVFAFYQNLMAIGADEYRGIRQAYETARRQARLWQLQNWAILGLLTMLVIVVFLNIAVLLFVVPQLLKTILGVDTPLSRSEILPLNSTFLAIALALTYAAIDPLIKAIYVLRCFYGESLATGEDLKAQLKNIAAQLAAQLMVIIFVLGCVNAIAQPLPPQPATLHKLDRSIDDVLTRPEFSWRLPHKQQPEEKTWLTHLLGDSFEKIGQWIGQFIDWLHERFAPNPQPERPKQGPPQLTVWLYALIGILALICLIFSIRMFRKRPAVANAEAIVGAVPDLASDHITASQLPPDEWLRTARECIARNDLRLAVRALYLANLAYLGGRSLISIDRSKSNNDYARELRRRARAKPEMVPVFNDTIVAFEYAWYGMYDVDLDLVARVEENLEKMRTCAEH